MIGLIFYLCAFETLWSMNVPDLSVVVPLLDEAKSITPLVEWIEKVLLRHRISYEILFVDDGSRDDSWERICEVAQAHQSVRGLSFSRNYGKSAALYVGFQHARAPVIITMDADLQDSPDELPHLYRKVAEEGYDMFSGWKKDRKDTLLKNWSSRFFNKVTSWLSGIRLHDFNCGLKAYRSEVARSLQLQGDMHRYIPLIAYWNGFTKMGEKPVQHYARRFGRSKFGWNRFMHGFLDLLSILFVTRFKRRPMHFFGLLGLVSFVLGAGIVGYLVWHKLYLLSHDLPAREVVDQPLFYFSLLAIMVGVQLFLAGFLAEMISLSSHQQQKYLITKRLPCDTTS